MINIIRNFCFYKKSSLRRHRKTKTWCRWRTEYARTSGAREKRRRCYPLGNSFCSRHGRTPQRPHTDDAGSAAVVAWRRYDAGCQPNTAAVDRSRFCAPAGSGPRDDRRLPPPPPRNHRVITVERDNDSRSVCVLGYVVLCFGKGFSQKLFFISKRNTRDPAVL